MKVSELFRTKWYDTDKYDLGYLDHFYDLHLPAFQDQPINLLEIGVYRGGSIRLWVDYFAKSSTIYAADKEPFEPIAGSIQVLGDCYSEAVVAQFSDHFFDLIIDDGPHTLESFLFLLCHYQSKLKQGGMLIIEDVLHKTWADLLVQLAKRLGYAEAEVHDLSGRQKTKALYERWKTGLYIVRLVNAGSKQH